MRGGVCVMDYSVYIREELLILIPVMYLVGALVKKSKIEDRWIPYILGIISVLLAMIWVASTGEINNYRDCGKAIFTSITQGVLIAGASVYANQLCVQSKKKNKE